MMLEFEIKLFGAFRKYEEQGRPIHVRFDQPIQISQLKKGLLLEFQKRFPMFQDSDLISDSAIANESQVFSSDHLLSDSCTLFILPPVCGG